MVASNPRRSGLRPLKRQTPRPDHDDKQNSPDSKPRMSQYKPWRAGLEVKQQNNFESGDMGESSSNYNQKPQSLNLNRVTKSTKESTRGKSRRSPSSYQKDELFLEQLNDSTTQVDSSNDKSLWDFAVEKSKIWKHPNSIVQLAWLRDLYVCLQKEQIPENISYVDGQSNSTDPCFMLWEFGDELLEHLGAGDELHQWWGSLRATTIRIGFMPSIPNLRATQGDEGDVPMTGGIPEYQPAPLDLRSQLIASGSEEFLTWARSGLETTLKWLKGPLSSVAAEHLETIRRRKNEKIAKAQEINDCEYYIAREKQKPQQTQRELLELERIERRDLAKLITDHDDLAWQKQIAENKLAALNLLHEIGFVVARVLETRLEVREYLFRKGDTKNVADDRDQMIQELYTSWTHILANHEGVEEVEKALPVIPWPYFADAERWLTTNCTQKWRLKFSPFQTYDAGISENPRLEGLCHQMRDASHDFKAALNYVTNIRKQLDDNQRNGQLRIQNLDLVQERVGKYVLPPDRNATSHSSKHVSFSEEADTDRYSHIQRRKTPPPFLLDEDDEDYKKYLADIDSYEPIEHSPTSWSISTRSSTRHQRLADLPQHRVRPKTDFQIDHPGISQKIPSFLTPSFDEYGRPNDEALARWLDYTGSAELEIKLKGIDDEHRREVQIPPSTGEVHRQKTFDEIRAFITSPDIARIIEEKKEFKGLLGSKVSWRHTLDGLIRWLNSLAELPWGKETLTDFINFCVDVGEIFTRRIVRGVPWLMRDLRGWETVSENLIMGPKRRSVYLTVPEGFDSWKAIIHLLREPIELDSADTGCLTEAQIKVIIKKGGHKKEPRQKSLHEMLNHCSASCDLFMWENKNGGLIRVIRQGWPPRQSKRPRQGLARFQADKGTNEEVEILPLHFRPVDFDAWKAQMKEAYIGNSGDEWKSYKPLCTFEELRQIFNNYYRDRQDVPIPRHRFMVYLRACRDRSVLFTLYKGNMVRRLERGWENEVERRKL